VLQQYGDADVPGASNIVFSNGNLDPWISGGITANVSRHVERDVTAIVIEGGAHHADLRASEPSTDPPSLTQARLIERAAIARWLAQHARTHPRAAAKVAEL
jgi:hypothetical protein